MKIKSIYMFNFKSFQEKVEILNVSEQANILVGKNGAGKSSVIFAIKYLITPHWKISPGERRAIVSEHSQELTAHVEILFDNGDESFPGGQTVLIRRTVTQKGDEYHVDGRYVPREEMVSMFETSGLTKATPYYVVEQGRIGELAQMTGKERMDLIREMAGSTVYEQEKQEGRKVLEEAERIEEKISTLVDALQKKTRAAEEETRKQEERKELERVREVVLKELYKRELNKIRQRIEENVEETTEATIQESTEMLQMQLEEVLTKIPAEYQNAPVETEEMQRQYAEAEDSVEEKRKRLAAIEEETSFLEATLSLQKAIGPEIHTIYLEGEAAVKEKIREIKNEINDQKKDNYAEKRENAMEKKRYIWKKELDLQKRKKQLEEKVKELERSFLLENNGFLLGNEIRSIPGVLGYVYELVSIPNEILIPLTQAQPHLLTSIAVDTRETALHLARAHKVEQTIIPILSLSKRPNGIKDLNPLSMYISCAPEHVHLVEYLFGSLYYISEFEQAKRLSKDKGISVISSNGEYFSSSGSITGGEQRPTKFKEFIHARASLRECQKEQEDLNLLRSKSEVESAIYLTDTHTPQLTSFLFLLENKEVDPEILLLEKLAVKKHLIINYQKEKQKQEKEKKLITSLNRIKENKLLAQQIEKKLKQKATPSWKDKTQERFQLESKFRRLQKKVLLLNADSPTTLQIDHNKKLSLLSADKNELLSSLSHIQKRISSLPICVGAPDHISHDYVRITSQIEELKRAKEKILSMQLSLDKKKEEVINITVMQAKENFEYFFRMLTHGTAKVSRSNNNTHLDIHLSFAGEPLVSAEELSSGQKSISALCFILSLQSIYQAPFYLLDEFDANLDTYFLQNIIGSSLFSNKQLFISTFRGETLLLGTSFFHVADRNVSLCTSTQAQELLCSYLPTTPTLPNTTQ
ncbi:structural maintenance of chromosome 3 (chondroitin sulfate proteoglycan 6) [Nematocida sp. LUAm3]|nr:structural maintenance of chromosome 3 (chondroitin sulfate proteoglycan 6) [Nematocida sp. LUAm3]KAI5174496.1 structural maintenance of chromosome 3 (chondroitin sulfate proteoglycan 6) [Nematocida sp. LUAm2]